MLFLLAVVFRSLLAPGLYAQELEVAWRFYVDGRPSDLHRDLGQSLNRMPLDSLSYVALLALENLRHQGYYFASLDSISQSPRSEPPVRVQLFYSRGAELRIKVVSIEGAQAVEPSTLVATMTTRRGRTLEPNRLLEDIDRILRFYERRGYPFARLEVESVQVRGDEVGGPGLEIVLHVEEGDRVRINDIVLTGADRTRRAFVERVTGLRRGEWLNQNLRDVRRALEASRFFSRVYDPVFIAVSPGEVVLQIPVEEEAPGAFDLVLGYQPPGSGGRSSGLVGSGHLNLRNMFGQGRAIALRLNRLPGQVSRVEARYADPFLFAMPFSLEGGFEGLQQDSTYGQQKYQGALGYRFGEGLEIFFSISREVTKPGQAGVQLRHGVQRIPRAEVLFAGLTFRYTRLDRIENPRRGLFIETRLERGRKQRSSFQLTAEADTSSIRTVVRQERLTAIGRLYVPTFRRQAVALGNETRVLASRQVDESDLFRLGGAQSLRGYDEDRFRGRFVTRAFFEYRYLFEQRSYAYVFFDLGYVERPATTELDASRRAYPGYGFGIQFETGIGLVNTSLALSTSDSPSQARVHVGLSVGL